MTHILMIALFGFMNAVNVYADANYLLMKDLVGVYPVLERNGDFTVAGKAEIFADDTGLGIKLSSLKMATNPLTDQILSSPKATTTLSQNGNLVEQNYKEGDRELKILYAINDGYLKIDATDCRGGICTQAGFTFSSGKSPGEQISTKEFLTHLRGDYSIVSVGNAPPHPESNTGDITPTDEPEVDLIRMPYCQPKGCDPGYLDMPYATTRVYKTSTVYTIIQTAGKKVLHFTWSEGPNKQSKLTNYQYKLLTKEVVGLEHIVEKKRD